MKTFIIAEAGVNHNCDISLACDMVDVAAEAGADAIKFQTFKAEKLVTKEAVKADYQKSASKNNNETQYEMLKKLELSNEAHDAIIRRCSLRNIEFLSTGFDIESIDFLIKKGISRIKIPSGEITNKPYLKHISNTGLPVIMSTGMSGLGEIEAALDVLVGPTCDLSRITVLHCNTEYPTPFCDANLLAIKTIKSAFNCTVGYSDHTEGIEASIAAVALGATVIEKHFTMDRRLDGPDQQASIEPYELKSMISSIRNIEAALGTGSKRPTESERKNIHIARKSLVASSTIKKGDILSVSNMTAKRPGSGISPMEIDRLIGVKAVRSYRLDEQIDQ